MDQPGPAAPSSARLLGGWLRRVVAGLLVGVVVLAAAGAGLWLFRVPAASWLIARAAESVGLGPARLTIDRLDLSGLIIRDLRLGDGDLVTVAEVTASYTLEQLRRGSIDTLRLRGVRLQAVVDRQAIRIGGFVRPLGQGREQRRGLPALPLRSLEFDRLEVVVETPLGPVAAAGAGGVQARPDGGIGLTWDGRIDGGGGADVRATGDVRGGAGGAIVGDLALSIAGGLGAFTGALAGQVTGSRSVDGAVSLQATVGDGEVRYRDGRVDGISGTAAYAMAADGTRTVRTALVRQANWQKVGGASPPERRSNRTTFLREPCVGSREGAGEASVAAWMGRAIEHRKSDGPGCRGFQIGRRQYCRRRFGEMSASPAVSENPCTFARLLLGPWEVFKLPRLS